MNKWECVIPDNICQKAIKICGVLNLYQSLYSQNIRKQRRRTAITPWSASWSHYYLLTTTMNTNDTEKSPSSTSGKLTAAVHSLRLSAVSTPSGLINAHDQTIALSNNLCPSKIIAADVSANSSDSASTSNNNIGTQTSSTELAVDVQEIKRKCNDFYTFMISKAFIANPKEIQWFLLFVLKILRKCNDVYSCYCNS